mmetsp:Transcript_88250/g.244924  ORF Transcript_88250/g.244924 Transcript_88250/m.244924 type:complete len:226 (-) Transcript_88250:456-1133(-)
MRTRRSGASHRENSSFPRAPWQERIPAQPFNAQTMSAKFRNNMAGSRLCKTLAKMHSANVRTLAETSPSNQMNRKTMDPRNFTKSSDSNDASTMAACFRSISAESQRRFVMAERKRSTTAVYCLHRSASTSSALLRTDSGSRWPKCRTKSSTSCLARTSSRKQNFPKAAMAWPLAALPVLTCCFPRVVIALVATACTAATRPPEGQRTSLNASSPSTKRHVQSRH